MLQRNAGRRVLPHARAVDQVAGGQEAGHENYLVRNGELPAFAFATRRSPLPRFDQDIVIYNEDSDMHVHIPFAEALEASCIFEARRTARCLRARG